MNSTKAEDVFKRYLEIEREAACAVAACFAAMLSELSEIKQQAAGSEFETDLDCFVHYVITLEAQQLMSLLPLHNQSVVGGFTSENESSHPPSHKTSDEEEGSYRVVV